MSAQKLSRDIFKTLNDIDKNIKSLSAKVDSILELQKKSSTEARAAAKFGESDYPYESLDAMTLLSLPDHLRKTAMAICKLGKSTADEIAANTKRARAVESNYLNQLVLMDLLKRERKGRKVFFYFESVK